MSTTLLLDVGTWDLCTDSAGNIAVADDPYALAQDVASACRTVLAEVWYDTTQGIRYLASTGPQFLGERPQLSVLTDAIATAAKAVPGVADASCTITGYDVGAVTGQVVFTSTTGVTQTLALL